MYVLTIDDDSYGYQKKNCFHFVRKKYPVFQPVENKILVFRQKKKKTVSPKITQAPPPTPPPPKFKWSVPKNLYHEPFHAKSKVTCGLDICVFTIRRAPNVDSDQTGRMSMLIRIYAGCIFNYVCFLESWPFLSLKCGFMEKILVETGQNIPSVTLYSFPLNRAINLDR